MRITGLTVAGVGGVPDGFIALPRTSVAAFAGGNGTGKSKLLACLLSPWSHYIPTSSSAEEGAEVRVHMELTDLERESIQKAGAQTGWGDPPIPETIEVIRTHHPIGGNRGTSNPPFAVLQNIWNHQAFMQHQPSLNVIYLPAERRLMPTPASAIDLGQLSDQSTWQKTVEPRTAVQNYGRLDDAEFEQFAKALCVAETLPDEGGSLPSPDGVPSRVLWTDFKATVDGLIAPKVLLPLTRQHPDQLRIRTPSGTTHLVHDLSSGERQALIIISRVARAGAGHSLVLIDEPDAYLHPHLSQRLTHALSQGVGDNGQLIVATHSPSILDSLPPTAIIRLSHDAPPRLVADESERLDFYRSAGFRASALTQADLLVFVEGDGDVPLVSLLIPELARAALKEAGGRSRVIREVEQLAPYEIPVTGAIDRDVLASDPPEAVSSLITTWPTADIEGVFLSDDLALSIMIDRGLVRPEFRTIGALRSILDDLVDSWKENVVSELAQRILRQKASWEWPSPRGEGPTVRLREAALSFRSLTSEEVEAAILEAEQIWDQHSGHARWRLLRGKYVVGAFASKASEIRSGRALLEALARERPNLVGIAEFKQNVLRHLG